MIQKPTTSKVPHNIPAPKPVVPRPPPKVIPPKEVCPVCTKEMEDYRSVIMLQTTECFHKLHKNCFTKYVFSQTKNNIPVVCPHSRCKREVEQTEITEYMTKEEKEELEKMTIDNYIKNDPNMAICPCGAVIEVS